MHICAITQQDLKKNTTIISNNKKKHQQIPVATSQYFQPYLNKLSGKNEQRIFQFSARFLRQKQTSINMTLTFLYSNVRNTLIACSIYRKKEFFLVLIFIYCLKTCVFCQIMEIMRGWNSKSIDINHWAHDVLK